MNADAVGGIPYVNINELVVEGISDLPGIFEPAESLNLKRSWRGETARRGAAPSPITEVEHG